jgi:hypothetical protein
VLVEDLPANGGARDESANGDLVDPHLVGHRERGIAQQGADPFCPGICAVRSCGHIHSLNRFVDT